jgi:hypothetical protein
MLERGFLFAFQLRGQRDAFRRRELRQLGIRFTFALDPFCRATSPALTSNNPPIPALATNSLSSGAIALLVPPVDPVVVADEGVVCWADCTVPVVSVSGIPVVSSFSQARNVNAMSAAVIHFVFMAGGGSAGAVPDEGLGPEC